MVGFCGIARRDMLLAGQSNTDCHTSAGFTFASAPSRLDATAHHPTYRYTTIRFIESAKFFMAPKLETDDALRANDLLVLQDGQVKCHNRLVWNNTPNTLDRLKLNSPALIFFSEFSKHDFRNSNIHKLHYN